MAFIYLFFKKHIAFKSCRWLNANKKERWPWDEAYILYEEMARESEWLNESLPQTHIFSDFSFMCNNNLSTLFKTAGLECILWHSQLKNFYRESVVTDSEMFCRVMRILMTAFLRLNRNWVLDHHAWFFML